MSSTPFVKFKQDLGNDKVALNTAGYGMTESGIWVPIKVTDEGVQEVQLSGTITEVVLANGIDITAGSTVYILTSEIENVELINLAKKARLYYNGTNIKDISITHYGRLGTGSATTAGTVLVTGLPGGYDTRILNDIVIEPLLLTKGSSQYTRFAFTNTGESDAANLRAVLALTI